MDVIINNPAASAPAFPSTVQGYGPSYGSGAYPAGYGPGWGHGGGNPLVGLLFIVGAVLLVRFALRRAWMRRGWGGGGRWEAARPEKPETGPNSGPRGPRWPFWDAGGEDSALKIARERFARSEISAEEFEAIRRGLSGADA